MIPIFCVKKKKKQKMTISIYTGDVALYKSRWYTLYIHICIYTYYTNCLISFLNPIRKLINSFLNFSIADKSANNCINEY